METILGIIGLLITAVIYFLPSIIVMKKKNRPVVPFFLINLFLGVTVIAWIVQLIISLKSDKAIPVSNVTAPQLAPNSDDSKAATQPLANKDAKKVELVWPLDVLHAKYGWTGVISGLVGIIILAVVIITSYEAASKAVSDQVSGKSGSFIEWASDAQKNTAQYKFESSLSKFLDEYKQGQNEIQKSAVYAKFPEHLKSYITQNGVFARGWICTVQSISTDRGGDSADLSLKSIYSVDANPLNIFFDAGYSQLNIPKGSPVYDMIASLKEGSKVSVDFNFVLDRKGDVKRLPHPTEQFGLASPDFSIEVVSIGALK